MAISANQVTMLRILLLPVPVYLLLYGDQIKWWFAFGIFVILGATDFIDGAMARREGGTKLGSLLDPVADKIFITAILLSLVTIGMFPAWVISVILVRELLVTALRSSVAVREAAIKTSKLGKIKTIIQMGGFGTIFLSLVTGEYFSNISILLSLPFLLAALYFIFRSQQPKFWMLPVFSALFVVGALGYVLENKYVLMFQLGIIITITWVSAIDYLIGCYRLFRQSGIYWGDVTRITWSIVFGLFAAPLVSDFPNIVLPVLACVSLEFGLGGIDNIVVTEKKLFSPWPFVISSLAGLVFALGLNISVFYNLHINSFYWALSLAFASFVTCFFVFIRHINIFKIKS